MGRKTKYRPKFAKELLNGLRRTCDIAPGTGKEYLMSIERICWRWGITLKTYWNWVNEFTSFREAHEHAEVDFIVCCQEYVHDEGAKGKAANSILTKYLMGNIGSGMSDKKEVLTTVDKLTIPKIQFEIIMPRQHEALEDKTNVIDITNVTEIKAS